MSVFSIDGFTCIQSNPAKIALMRVFTDAPNRSLLWENIVEASGLTPEQAAETLRALQEEGVRILHPSPHHALYKPNESFLHPDTVATHLRTRWWGHCLFTARSITSSIDLAKALAKREAVHGMVVSADHQSRGRGRLGAVWSSPTGKDILVTFLIRLQEWRPSSTLLSLYATAAIARMLDQRYGAPIGIKWPNDLVAANRKLGGVMAEIDSNLEVAIVSMGMNVHSGPADWPDDTRDAAVSLSMLKTETWRREKLLAECGAAWESLWDASLKDRGRSILDCWEQYSTTLGKRVTLQCRGEELTGKVLRIDLQGRLELAVSASDTRVLPSEEARSLRVLE